MSHPGTSRVLLANAPRTANTQTPKQQDGFTLVVRLYLNVTVASGSGGLRPVLRGYDKASGATVELTTGGTGITTTGLFCYEISGASLPSTAFGNVKEVACRSIPFQWDALVKHLDGSTYNYSLSADITSL